MFLQFDGKRLNCGIKYSPSIWNLQYNRKDWTSLLMKKNIFIFVSMINYRRVIIFSRKYTGSVLKLTHYLTKLWVFKILLFCKMGSCHHQLRKKWPDMQFISVSCVNQGRWKDIAWKLLAEWERSQYILLWALVKYCNK